MKKLIIISVISVVVVVIVLSSIFLFSVVGKSLHDKVFSLDDENSDLAEEKEIIFTSSILDYCVKLCYSNAYTGVIEKVEGNKIYFTVDKKGKSKAIGPFLVFIDVEDYQMVFDINTYNLEYDPLDTHRGTSAETDIFAYDRLCFEYKDFYSASELKFLVGKYLRAGESMFEICSTSKTNETIKTSKTINFYEWDK